MINQLIHASVGTPITREGVSFFPVYLRQDHPNVIAGPLTLVEFSEQPGATVPSLVVRNHHKTPVLIAEGETLNGGWQNRVVNTSVLVPALSTLDLPVSCVEAGRWGGEREFGRRGPKAPRRVRRSTTGAVSKNLRSQNSRHSDQGKVWAAVDHELDALGVRAETRAVENLIIREQHDEELGRAIADLCNRGPLPGQAGVVITQGRRVVAAEVYATPEMLAACWDMVVRGYLLEARVDPQGRPSATKVLRFLDKMAKGVVSVNPGVGLGQELRIETPKIAGQALINEGLLIHASAFALAA